MDTTELWDHLQLERKEIHQKFSKIKYQIEINEFGSVEQLTILFWPFLILLRGAFRKQSSWSTANVQAVLFRTMLYFWSWERGKEAG